MQTTKKAKKATRHLHNDNWADRERGRFKVFFNYCSRKIGGPTEINRQAD